MTLSLAGLGFGFQYRSYGIFLVAAASSVAFWSLEGALKRHQMRHYPRMRQIEVNRHALQKDQEQGVSAPRIDWSWAHAEQLFRGRVSDSNTPPRPRGRNWSYDLVWLMPQVALPHAITLALGATLFILGYVDCLPGFTLGAFVRPAG